MKALELNSNRRISCRRPAHVRSQPFILIPTFSLALLYFLQVTEKANARDFYYYSPASGTRKDRNTKVHQAF